MKTQKIYEAEDQMITLIRDNYNILQSLGMFGITLGFGDKTVRQTCETHHVDCHTFLVVVNYMLNGYTEDNDMPLSIETLLHYLRESHRYYIDFQLPFIRKELQDALDENDSLAKLIMRLYDEYAKEIRLHMHYEERTLFPYVESLMEGNTKSSYNIDTFSKHHVSINRKLKELKSIILKYLPADSQHSNLLSATLYDIYNNEEWLRLHANVEDNIFVPAIRKIENQLNQNQVTTKISEMLNRAPGEENTLSEREKDVVVALVQGMANKEIADHLCISLNTVITHRRNIARKLQIHSPAGLTIYAIVNNLVNINMLKIE